MKKIISILLMLTICASFQLTAYASEPTNTLPSGLHVTDIDSTVDSYVADHKDTTAAVSVSVFTGSKVLMEKAYGYTDIENGLINNSNSVFEWGSCTKLLTWVSVMQLVEQNKINLNEDIRHYLPKGFFKKLKYDTPITMLNLMNHNAGWQEISTDLFIKNKKDIKDLGTALQYIEPEQLNKPGEIVAYSNWGTALAGYIVECVSGQSFTEYVHQNIFEPLGMEHTALSADLSDNEWVAKQRAQEKCYTTECKSLGTYYYYLPMYPAGATTGTLDDFIKFAQAFLPAEGKASPLFKKAETLNEMLSPSRYYADTEIARICHGFWTDALGVTVLWHNGSTNGSSSWFAFDRASGTGVVILTNQSGESIYNQGLLPVIFGKNNVPKYTASDNDISGVYASARSCYQGYSKLYGLFTIRELKKTDTGLYQVAGTKNTITEIGANSYVMDIGGLKQSVFYTTSNAEGKTILQMTGADYVQINGSVLISKFILLVLFVIAVLYSLIVLIKTLVSFIKRKKLPTFGTYRLAVNFSVLASLSLFVYMALQLFTTNSAMFKDIQWSLITCVIMAIVPVIYTILLVIKMKGLNLTKREKTRLIINSVMGLIVTFNVFYWTV